MRRFVSTLKNYLVIDTETNIFQKGNPFSRQGKLVAVGLRSNQYSNNLLVTNPQCKEIVQNTIDKTRLLVLFNAKFDLHWLKRYGIDFSKCLVWDCQLAHFLLTAQEFPFPSLNDSCTYYGLPTKLDKIKLDFWDKGIDTEDIPPDILLEYLDMDLVLTEAVFLKQQKDFLKYLKLYQLFRIQCEDLLVLQEMEYNGMYFDTEASLELAKKEEEKLNQIEEQLRVGYENIPINFQSRDHLSCYLYGGTITHETRLPIGFYKTGSKQGLPRYKVIEYKYELPQLVVPPKEAELKKEGYYATDDTTLKNIRCSKSVRKKIDGILARSKASKLIGTYYRGIPELIQEMDWPDNKVHGQFNQCVAATGRLSSSKPNLQNFAEDVDILLKSYYDH